MRSETEQFKCDSDLVYAELDNYGEVCINVEKPDQVYYSYMTKQQAAEFARQLLEMCNEQDDS